MFKAISFTALSSKWQSSLAFAECLCLQYFRSFCCLRRSLFSSHFPYIVSLELSTQRQNVTWVIKKGIISVAHPSIKTISIEKNKKVLCLSQLFLLLLLWNRYLKIFLLQTRGITLLNELDNIWMQKLKALKYFQHIFISVDPYNINYFNCCFNQ